MSQHTTLEVGPDLPLNEVRDRRAARASIREEGLKLFPDDSVQKRLLRLAALVIGHANPVRDRGWWCQ